MGRPGREQVVKQPLDRHNLYKVEDLISCNSGDLDLDASRVAGKDRFAGHDGSVRFERSSTPALVIVDSPGADCRKSVQGLEGLNRPYSTSA